MGHLQARLIDGDPPVETAGQESVVVLIGPAIVQSGGQRIGVDERICIRRCRDRLPSLKVNDGAMFTREHDEPVGLELVVCEADHAQGRVHDRPVSPQNVLSIDQMNSIGRPSPPGEWC